MRQFTPEHRAKLRAAKLGKVPNNILNGSLAQHNRNRSYAPFSDEWRHNLSVAHKGQHPTTEFKNGSIPWNKGKRFPHLSGPRSPRWKGGATEAQKLIRNSADYRAWRQSVFERDGYRCVMCGDDRGGNLEADHIYPFSLYPDHRFDTNNGRTLCKKCHKSTNTYGSKVFKLNYVMA